MSQTSITPKSAGRPWDLELQNRRRSEIIATATRQFASSGYGATDVQLIADELGVAKGTVYRYYSTKEELFLATVDEGMQRLQQTVDEATAAAQSLIDRVELGIMGYLRYFDQHPDMIELIIQERAHFRDRVKPTYFLYRDANLDPWRELFGEMIRDGQIRDIPVDRITAVISDLLYGTIFTNHFAGRKKSLSVQCRDVIDVVFHGILATADSREQ